MKVPINFWPAQQKFFESGPQPTMLLAGVGHGKTYVGILKTLFLLDEYPGSRAAIIRKRFQDLKRTTAATLWQLLPPDHIARRNDNEGRLRLTNGSEIVMMHIDKPDSLSSLKSLELNFAYVDQAEDISAEAWDTL
jgi:phage terminase large subunit